MRKDTRSAVHFGANFVVVRQATLGQEQFLAFQGELAKVQIDVQKAQRSDREIVLRGSDQDPLRIQVVNPGPQVSQLLVIAEWPKVGLDLFARRVEATVAAFRKVWSGTIQVLSRDVTLRHLYDSGGDHAFQILWEQRLKQDGADFTLLHRGVLGGGIRFVMPPDPKHANQAEVKVESFLRDTSKLFVEVSMTWPNPVSADVGMKPGDMFREADTFAAGPVFDFITKGVQAE